MAEEGIATGGVMDVNTALQEVLKTALIHDGLACGIGEDAKVLDKRQAHLFINMPVGLKARRNWKDIYGTLKQEGFQPRISYPARLPMD